MDWRSFSIITQAALIAFAVVACGDAGGGPSDVSDITGTYSVTYTFTEPGTRDTFSCSGTVDITEQSDADFIGVFTVEETDDCADRSGSFAGTVAADGSISFTDLFEGVVGLDNLPGCDIVGGDSALTGTIAGEAISVSTTVQFRCRAGVETLQQFSLELAVTGTRTEDEDAPANPTVTHWASRQ